MSISVPLSLLPGLLKCKQAAGEHSYSQRATATMPSSLDWGLN